MGKELRDRQLRLIKIITEIDDIQDLDALEGALKKKKLTYQEESNIFKKIPKSISIEEMIAQQNWKSTSKKEFDKLVTELDIQEPIEELLKMLD